MISFNDPPKGYEVRCLKGSDYINGGLSRILSQGSITSSPYIIHSFIITTASVVYVPEMIPHQTDIATFQNILKSLFPSDKIMDTQVHSVDPYLQYLLQTSNGLNLTMKMFAPRLTTLLRHERHSLETEAHVLSLLGPSEIWCIPKLLRFDIIKSSPPTAYLLRHSLQGEPLSKIESILTPDDRKRIDTQLGIAIEQVAQHTAMAFGSVRDVQRGNGDRTWKQTFLNLIDSLLWNAENIFISLPYTEIRYHTNRLSAAFDDVTEPQLVVVNIGHISNVIVDPETKEISGFSNFTTAFWGDVLMTDIFEEPTSDMLDGYGSDPTQESSARIRILLYSCYRNIHKIVKQYYQNQQDDEELYARKALTAKLSTLSNIDL